MAVLDTFSLTGKVSAVTGANRGIGRALVSALTEAGSDVALLVRDPASAAEAVAELTDLDVRAITVGADVTRPDQVEQAVDRIADELGRVDVLVNNAGACIIFLASAASTFGLAAADGRGLPAGAGDRGRGRWRDGRRRRRPRPTRAHCALGGAPGRLETRAR